MFFSMVLGVVVGGNGEFCVVLGIVVVIVGDFMFFLFNFYGRNVKIGLKFRIKIFKY